MSRRSGGIAHGCAPTRPEPRVLRARRGSLLPADVPREGVHALTLGALLVLAPGTVEGAYSPRTWTALTILFAAVAGLGLLDDTHEHASWLTRIEVALFLALAVWAGVSGFWAVAGASPFVEARRCVLYAVALLAVAVHVRVATRKFLVLGASAGIVSLVVIGLAERALERDTTGTYYGSLLREPIGYPNGLGVLAGVGLLLIAGLVLSASTSLRVAALTASGSVLALALLLTGSRGAALATALGSIVWVAGPRLGERLVPIVVVGVVGATAWLAVPQADRGGPALIAAVAFAAVAGAFAARWLPVLAHRPRTVLTGSAVVAVLVLGLAGPPATTSSYRLQYWDAAIETAAGEPLAGAGAGSFAVSWLARRDVETDVRDAHSLYLESLAEPRPIGLALVVALVVVPVAAWWRSGRDDLGRLALAGWIVVALHAGIDWDWELPVVVLSALALAGALLASPCTAAAGSRKEEP